MTAAAPKPRTRKKPAVGAGDNAAIEGRVVEFGARRIFRGVKLPDIPVFTLESASDPDVVVEFTGISSLPGLTALELVTDGISSETLPEFFKSILGEEQYKTFKEFADDPATGITIDVLIELATYLMNEYTGRPTKGSSGS
jgi:hypothetical protein